MWLGFVVLKSHSGRQLFSPFLVIGVVFAGCFPSLLSCFFHTSATGCVWCFFQGISVRSLDGGWGKQFLFLAGTGGWFVSFSITSSWAAVNGRWSDLQRELKLIDDEEASLVIANGLWENGSEGYKLCLVGQARTPPYGPWLHTPLLQRRQLLSTPGFREIRSADKPPGPANGGIHPWGIQGCKLE
ncbi:hypothetical protein Salat_0193000 [Sesamum alatum]|uniref:Uncharacterized protein n=1 Tax=Sesamum alatum TaxID=300844 RepID=A0AAE1YXI1_9LAMI|nr:hypothetical protein Salat_0193000 [Sesamum alatum]